ncbi:alpha/beta fold hydrolase [Nocardia lijiangensis]|uniref:alpha/beta fold hydrolase n=1 Tax=Nocardia lijiangensis TaxID=299618 RepID=UPI0013905015|nr:alpha/beta fold hydrolase [Nocardia lijiangensis]
MTRLGPASSPASVVYVHGMLADSRYWTPLVEHLHARLDGAITQIVYDQRGHGHSPRPTGGGGMGLAVFLEDLDTVVAHAPGAVVLVAHSVAISLATAWVARYRPRARTLAGLVLFNGCPDFPPRLPSVMSAGRATRRRFLRRGQRVADLLSSGIADAVAGEGNLDAALDVLAAYGRLPLTEDATSTLRSIPTWVLAGREDPVVAAGSAARLAEQIWADFDSVPDAGHSLPFIDPVRAAAPVLAALEVAYRSQRQDGVPW